MALGRSRRGSQGHFQNPIYAASANGRLVCSPKQAARKTMSQRASSLRRENAKGQQAALLSHTLLGQTAWVLASAGRGPGFTVPGVSAPP